MKKFTFPKNIIIRDQWQFKVIFDKSHKSENRFFRIYYLSTVHSKEKFAFITKKRLGNAVVRNRYRRLVKEVCRRNQDKFKEGISIIFVLKNGVLNQTYQEIESSLLRLLKNCQLLNSVD